VAAPRRRVVEKTIRLPEAWPVTNFSTTIRGPASVLQVARSYRDRLLVLSYDYLALTNQVPPQRIREHITALNSMNQAMAYSLSWQDQTSRGHSSEVNWPILLGGCLYALILIGVAILIFRRLGPAVEPASADPSPSTELTTKAVHPAGLGGWLVLVGAGLGWTTLQHLVSLFGRFDTYSLSNWTALTSPSGLAYHPGWGPMLVLGLVNIITTLTFAGFLFVLYFQKRRQFSNWFVGWLLFQLVCGVAFYAGGLLMADALNGQSSFITAPQLGGIVIWTVVWIAYIRLSRRVKATFIR
jgi:hypothetical protein